MTQALMTVAKDLDLMARTVFGEARGEPLEGKVAVAWVIRNRVERGGWWGGSISEVVLKPRQFSAWNPDDPNLACMRAAKLDDSVFQDCCYVSLGVVRGHLPDPTDGATHYCAGSMNGAPGWAAGREPVCEIGGHRFYNNV